MVSFMKLEYMVEPSKLPYTKGFLDSHSGPLQGVFRITSGSLTIHCTETCYLDAVGNKIWKEKMQKGQNHLDMRVLHSCFEAEPSNSRELEKIICFLLLQSNLAS